MGSIGPHPWVLCTPTPMGFLHPYPWVLCTHTHESCTPTPMSPVHPPPWVLYTHIHEFCTLTPINFLRQYPRVHTHEFCLHSHPWIFTSISMDSMGPHSWVLHAITSNGLLHPYPWVLWVHIMSSINDTHGFCTHHVVRVGLDPARPYPRVLLAYDAQLDALLGV